MFTRRLLWLPTSLLYLLFASPVLAGHSPPTTPYDPFHAIAALAPKPSEEPICCLKPLSPLEPVDDDLFLSFEDWKAKRFIESNHSQKNNPSPNTGTTARVPAENPAEGAAHSPTTPADPSSSSSLSSSPVLDDALDMTDAAPTTHGAEGTAPPASPHFRVPLTDRFNYASLDCSARVHTAHRAAKSASNILSSKRDRYMLSPCDAAGPQFVVVELCDDIRIDTVQLANFEFFSGVFREFTVSVAKTYAAADAEGWTVVGTYVGKNVRGVQSFHPPTSLRDFYRYIRIEFHSHYSNEYYCPISLLRVYGLTHLEQWKWDTWEEESRARQDQNIHTTIVPADIPSEPHQPAESPRLAQDDPTTPQERLSPAALSSDFAPDFQDQGVEASHPSESEDQFRHSTDIARLEPSTSTQVPPSGSGSSVISSSSSASSQSPVSVQTTNHSMHMFISNDSTGTASSASSSVFISSRTANVSGINGSSPRSSSQPTVTTISAPHVTHTPALPPPQVNPPLPPSPSNVHTGESIYRTIMNRLSALEANTTLYARYVEEQTSAMREMLRRLSEDLGRLEGLGRAQAQMYARSVSDFERHRKEMEVEQRTLISQVNYLADEIVLEKRLGIAQLCLLLAVLVFLSVTRGSPGEFHIPRSNSSSADVTRGWGRRSLRLSGDWFPSRLRSSSNGPPSGSQGSHTPTTSNPIVPRAPRHGHPPQTAPPAFLPSPSTTPGPSYHHFLTNKAATATTPTFRQKRPPLYLSATPVQHHHHRAPRSRSTHAMTRSRPAGSAASPTTPPPMSIFPVPPLQRSSSHGTAFVGPVPRSARRWARSAHLHEVRRARQHHPHHQHQQHRHRGGTDADVGTDVDEDVFAAAAAPAHRSAPVAGSFGRDVTNNGGTRTRTLKGERAVNGGGGAGADTWVDTDTDADVDGDNGLWEVDAE